VSQTKTVSDTRRCAHSSSRRDRTLTRQQAHHSLDQQRAAL